MVRYVKWGIRLDNFIMHFSCRIVYIFVNLLFYEIMVSSPALDKIYYDYGSDVVRRRGLSIAGLQPNRKKIECIWIVDMFFFFNETQYTEFHVVATLAEQFQRLVLGRPVWNETKDTHTHTHTYRENTGKNRLPSFKGSNLKASCSSRTQLLFCNTLETRLTY